MSWEDFLAEFKKRHPKEYGLDSGRSVAVKAPVVRIAEKAPEIAVSVAQAVDRKSAAAGDDWADVWDDTSGEEEVLE